ncbi:hypothetical protein PR001_g26551 [Phytophthora rubi]|nr:hypothetical protein PR002_g26694 [Phytophthora rubi]KAE8972618.1 hypothetical protein PR001_g26551 [Phytophthora rubi]
MGNKNSRVRSPPYAHPSPYGRPSGSRTDNPNCYALSPAERGMLYCKTKNTAPAPTPSGLYGNKSASNSKQAPTPTTLYSKPSAVSTPKPTPTSLYSKKPSLLRGFSRSSISRSGSSIGQPSPFAMSRVSSAGSAYSQSAIAPNGDLAPTAMTSCVKCRMPFGDSTAAFCQDCGHPRPAGTIPAAPVQRVSDGRGSFGKHAVAF